MFIGFLILTHFEAGSLKRNVGIDLLNIQENDESMTMRLNVKKLLKNTVPKRSRKPPKNPN